MSEPTTQRFDFKFKEEIERNIRNAYRKSFEDILPVYIGSYHYIKTNVLYTKSFTELTAVYRSKQTQGKFYIAWQSSVPDNFKLFLLGASANPKNSLWISFQMIDESIKEKTLEAYCKGFLWTNGLV